MSKRITSVDDRKSRRRMTLLWVLVVTAIVITLLLLEQVALLYVLATLAVAGLLAVVALSDLGLARKSTELPTFDDAAAIGDGITAAVGSGTTPQPTTTTRASRSARRNTKTR